MARSYELDFLDVLFRPGILLVRPYSVIFTHYTGTDASSVNRQPLNLLLYEKTTTPWPDRPFLFSIFSCRMRPAGCAESLEREGCIGRVLVGLHQQQLPQWMEQLPDGAGPEASRAGDRCGM